jgi:predicted nucleotide-binding protein
MSNSVSIQKKAKYLVDNRIKEVEQGAAKVQAQAGEVGALMSSGNALNTLQVVLEALRAARAELVSLITATQPPLLDMKAAVSFCRSQIERIPGHALSRYSSLFHKYLKGGHSEYQSKCQREIDLVDAEIELAWPLSQPVSKQLSRDDIIKHRSTSNRIPKVFIGHGRSSVWKELKDFIVDQLALEYVEFNSESQGGRSVKERLLEMLNESAFALIVFTPEDIHADKSHHARENVIHEAGLFQGRLGFERAIIVMEETCSEFSNIHGITQLRFRDEDISTTFEEIRRVLEREGLIQS